MIDGIYPPRCLACNELTEHGANLCAECWRETAFISGTICGKCGTPLTGEATDEVFCDACTQHVPAWDHGRAALMYSGVGRRVIMALKHGDRIDMAKPLAGWMARAGADILVSADIIVPVPLHWRRFLRRRFNQSAELARHLGRFSETSVVPDALVRNIATEPQNEMTRDARFANQSGAFSIHKGRDVAGKRVVLVDDVMTSGATLSACATALRAAGAEQIDTLVLARVAPCDLAPIYSKKSIFGANDETG